MTTLEKLEELHPHYNISSIIGEYKTICENNNEVLIQNFRGFYYIVKEKGFSRLVLEDITWVANGILCKKKKRKFYNKTGTTKGEIFK